MNAGRRKEYRQSIADCIVAVDILDNGTIRTINKEDCQFDYRTSIFKSSNEVMISVIFQFEKIEPEIVETMRSDRIQFCRECQDNSKPNFGSVFSMFSPRIMTIAKKFEFKCGGASFFSKTLNWILNNNATYADVLRLIGIVEKIHKWLGKSIEREVIVWD